MSLLEMALESSSRQPLFKIDKYSWQQQIYVLLEVDHRNAGNLPTGHYVRSTAFKFDGCKWILHYYPQGKFLAHKGLYTSIFLVLLSINKNVTLRCQFILFGRDGRNWITDTFLHAFTNHNNISRFPIFFRKGLLNQHNYCQDGIVHIGCHIAVVNLLDMQHSGGLQEHIMNLQERGDFDVTFEVEGKHIHAHKLIVAARSPVLRASLFGPMSEANKGNIQIKEMKPNVFKALISFMYTDNLTKRNSDGDRHSNKFLEDVFAAADRFLVDRLRVLCEERLAENLSISTAASTLILAHQLSNPSNAWLKERCLQFVSELENFVQLVFSDGFLEIMEVFPSLFAELCQKMYL